MDEYMTPRPEDPYGIAKYAVEMDLHEAHEMFAQTPENSVRQRRLHVLEGQVLEGAKIHIATSAPLAVAPRLPPMPGRPRRMWMRSSWRPARRIRRSLPLP